jgi:hypothetical protein
MPHAPTPWVGLAAVLAMFVLPLLPDWLFEGPRTIRHRPLRRICGDCNAPWNNDHTCTPIAGQPRPPLYGELWRVAPPGELEGHPLGSLATRPLISPGLSRATVGGERRR